MRTSPGLAALLSGVASAVLIHAACGSERAPLAARQAETPTSEIPNADTLALVHGTLVDGRGGEPLPDAVVVFGRGGIIAAGASGRVEIPPGAGLVDVGGATILPGFINAHVHDAYSARNLEAWAQAGVTTVRDEGIVPRSASLPELVARRDNEWGQPQHARLVSSGWMITAPGGYGQLAVSSAAEARQRAGEELDQGADLLKVAVEDGIAGRTDLPVLSPEALAAVVATARERGKAVSAHVTDARFLQVVVEAGVDDAAHATWDPIPAELMQRMIASHISLVPTLTVLEAYGALSGAQANLRRFAALGGQVALGNDYTDVPQNGFDHFELGMPMHEIGRMAEAGMTPMQIVVAATRNAAHVCGLEQELGTIEAGQAADLLVVNGDPLRDLNALLNVRLVVHRGVVIRH